MFIRSRHARCAWCLRIFEVGMSSRLHNFLVQFVSKVTLRYKSLLTGYSVTVSYLVQVG